ncbi:PREDICTED: uncharacterized protein LOC105623387 [Atta cephalotes]|uniref:Uncharacterized protein n=1 Tax=Atta cephalotes TaxID=12957 RepID=A0A158NRL2_ATTCE|nr:PREDICTED: uncharacterized protein LOC105623387 [Atta cephalotes]
MARSSIIDIGSVFDEYLLKEQHFEREIEERNKLRREIRNKNIFKVSDSSPTDLPLNLEKSRIRNQALLKNVQTLYVRQTAYFEVILLIRSHVTQCYLSFCYNFLQLERSLS